VCAPLFAALMLAAAPSASAQCAGDCNGDGQVTVDELLTMVNIALGNAPVDGCLPGDPNADGQITVDEILTAVTNALNGCAMVTPTPTPTSETVTPNPTPTTPPGCGNGTTEFAAGETCDDGNTLDGDDCPGNCRILSCPAAGTTVDVDIDFAPPSGVDLAGITVFLRYPDGVVRIPGRLGSIQVLDRISNVPENAFSQPNDLDYGLRLVIFTPDSSAIAAGRLATVRFDVCQGAAAPTAAGFRCAVDNAGDTNSVMVAGVTCSASLP
jgi:cysteine-rich repeat protein